MKYSISVNLNRITNYVEDFEKARLYHLKHGVDITYNFKDVNVTGYTSKLGTIDVGAKRYLLSGAEKLVPQNTSDATMFAFDMNEWSTPPGSPFPLRPDTPSGDCTIWGNKPFINLGFYPTEQASGQTWIKIAHEIMHALVYTFRLKGNAIQDVMDTYLHNDNPDHPDGNFARQWKLLEPFINPTRPTLKEGMKSKDVLDLQTYLKTLGYFNQNPTSYFGSITKQSVKDFQQANGLVADGFVGKNTWAKLLDLIAKKKLIVEKIGQYQLYPLVERARIAFIEACRLQGEEIRVTEGYRSFERQNELYAQGRTTKGAIVTNAKAGDSLHNFGVAFDVIFTKTGYKGNWAKIGKIGKALGLTWGGDFTSIKDSPHFELLLSYKLKDFKNNKVDFSKFQ